MATEIRGVPPSGASATPAPITPIAPVEKFGAEFFPLAAMTSDQQSEFFECGSIELSDGSIAVAWRVTPDHVQWLRRVRRWEPT